MHVGDGNVSSLNIPGNNTDGVKEKPCDRQIQRNSGSGFFPPEDFDNAGNCCEKIKCEGYFKKQDIRFKWQCVYSLICMLPEF